VTLSLFNGFENINTISFTVQYLTLQAMGVIFSSFYPSTYVAFFHIDIWSYRTYSYSSHPYVIKDKEIGTNPIDLTLSVG